MAAASSASSSSSSSPSSSPSLSPSPSPSSSSSPSPTCVLFLGMAGCGKSTSVSRLYSHLTTNGSRCYIINLDPAVSFLPYEPNLDIRDTVDYKNVLKTYNLGPNGAIMTSLNLFATKFDQVLDILELRKLDFDYILVDTPGQIEAFTWSASGSIVSEALASSFPCVALFVTDTPRSDTPATFMANMLFACSIMYRTSLPFRMAFNKIDVRPANAAISWMQDYEALVSAVNSHSSQLDEGDTPFVNSFVTSTSLFLEEFYSTIVPVPFSASTGLGCDEVVESIISARNEYFAEYLPALQRRQENFSKSRKPEKNDEILKLLADLKLSNVDYNDFDVKN